MTKDYFKAKTDNGKPRVDLITEDFMDIIFNNKINPDNKYAIRIVKLLDTISIPKEIIFLECGYVLARGAELYGENTWQTVPDAIPRYKAAYLRHRAQAIINPINREDGNLLHIAQAFINLMFLMELDTEESHDN